MPGGPLLVTAVRDRFARHGVPATHAAVVAAVRQQPAAAVLGDEAVLHLADRVHAELVGAGPIAPLLADQEVTDVLVNGTDAWVDRGAGLHRHPIRLGTADDVRRLAQRLAAGAGRRLDDASPYVDVCLPDGTRLHAVLPPVATGGPYLCFRTFRPRPFTLADFVAAGALEPAAAAVLAAVVAARLPYLVTGGTGCGKPTVPSVLLSRACEGNVPRSTAGSAKTARAARPVWSGRARTSTRSPNATG